MTRLIAPMVPEPSVGVVIDLILGPYEFTEQELELAWHGWGAEMLRDHRPRPWAWRFEEKQS